MRLWGAHLLHCPWARKNMTVSNTLVMFSENHTTPHG